MRHFLRYSALILFICFGAQLKAQTSNFHRWNFDFGGGVTPVAGYSSGQFNTGWNIVGGGGLNLTSHFGFAGQFMWDGLGVNQSVIKMFHVPSAAAHIWSLTLNPEVRFRSHRRVGFYVIGGGGFYRATIQFLQPTTEV
ncbi:MAG TPA: outer membrane beta-barrel protein, partial [Terriglobia bacterium]|nr:outer membrane beta-barrel protein [Terriglobia bacterium]